MAANQNTSGVRDGQIPVKVSGMPGMKGASGHPKGTRGDLYSSSPDAAVKQGKQDATRNSDNRTGGPAQKDNSAV